MQADVCTQIIPLEIMINKIASINHLSRTYSNHAQTLCVILALLFISSFATAQFDQTDWAKCFGGTATEAAGTAVLNSIGACSGSAAHAGAGEYYIITSSNSADGTIYGNKGSDDIWLAKLNTSGDTLWSKVIGGSNAERAYKVRALSGGGCVLVGQTLSNNGDFTGNQGLNDGFIAKISADGAFVWKK